MYLIVLLASLSGFATARASVCLQPKLTVPSAYHVDRRSYAKPGTIEVYCSSEINQLIINSEEEMPLQVVNATTVKTVVNAEEGPLYLICCCANSNICSNYELLEVQYHPNVTGLTCFSKNFEALSCSWNSNSFGNTYKLLTSYTDSLQICKGSIHYGYTDYSCLWNLKNIDIFSHAHRSLQLPLRLEICNAFVCINHTNDVDLRAISKLNAPIILDIKSDGSYRVTLKWRITFSELILQSDIEISYVVEYSLGMGYNEFTSGTSNFNQFTTVTDFLKLPCSDKKYTVRIACRPASAPLEYMSDFMYTTVRTEPDTKATGLDPICSVKPKPVETPPVLVYKVQVFRQEVDEDIEKYERLKKRLKEKIAIIKKFQL